jgi:glycosyltransferase involved in cell wall biosynthesis
VLPYRAASRGRHSQESRPTIKVLAFGTYDKDAHPRIAVLLEGLRAHGDEIVEVNQPLGLGTADRVAMLTKPWRLPALVLRLLHRWTTLARRGRRAYRQERPDVILVGYLGHLDVRLARLLFRRTPIVLDHLIFAADTARDRGVQRGWRPWLLGRLDRAALRAADLILLDTPEHAAMVPPELADRTLVVPVGAPDTWFVPTPGSEKPVDGPLRVVFFGLYTPLQGAPTIGRAIRLLADRDDIEFTMIGSGQDLSGTRVAAAMNPQVDWRDWVPAADLPQMVRQHHVCLGIFGTGPKALRVVPNKVYQGAAAGCAVITSDTGPQRTMLGDAAAYVPPGDVEALAKTLRRLADDPMELASLRKHAAERACTEFTPEVVVRGLREQVATLSQRSRL